MAVVFDSGGGAARVTFSFRGRSIVTRLEGVPECGLCFGVGLKGNTQGIALVGSDLLPASEKLPGVGVSSAWPDALAFAAPAGPLGRALAIARSLYDRQCTAMARPATCVDDGTAISPCDTAFAKWVTTLDVVVSVNMGAGYTGSWAAHDVENCGMRRLLVAAGCPAEAVVSICAAFVRAGGRVGPKVQIECSA